MTHFKVYWKIRAIFSTPDLASASVRTRRRQVADRTQTTPLTLPQTVPSQEGRKGLFQEMDGRLIALRKNGAERGYFFRFGGRDN
jgi:hypothetical protein